MKEPGYSALRKGRTSLLNQIYHVSFCTHQRRPYFSDLYLARQQVLAMQKQNAYCKILCFIVMPDHVHWLLQLTTANITLSEVVRRSKITTCHYFRKQSSERLWQDGFYDRALRKEDDIYATARYIILNPVRAKLVERVGLYSHWDTIFF
jgi:putative transposase